jgi:hypothetical protein
VGGFIVSEGAVGYRDGLRYMVNGAFLKEWQARTLATYESCKDENAEPDGLAIEYMAEGCRRIAEHDSLSGIEADEGRELFQRFKDWSNPHTDVPVEQLRVLCKRMAYFLTRNFAYLWPECVPDQKAFGSF